ncbi:MAG: EAL domain-containing protein, partial [Bradyrhizobium sp.]
ELILIAPSGQIMCTDSGALSGRSELISTAATANPEIVLDVVRPAGRGDRYLRMRKLGERDRPTLAALISANLLLPRAWLPGGRSPGEMRMAMPDGTPVGEAFASEDIAGAHLAPYQHRAQSKRYGLRVTVSSAAKGAIASYDDLRHIGMVVSGAIAFILLSLALTIAWRRDNTPITDIAKGMLANEFEPYYQPVVDIQTGKILGAEVLVRWHRADGSLVEPNSFVSLVETSGLMPELTRRLMQRVRNDLGEAFGQRPEMTVAFNVVPQHFEDAVILNDIGTIFDASPIKLTQIVLELTERYEVANLGSTRRTIAALQGMGCKVAIDDVGTGHSGLSYILKLGVDIIKIDKIFVEAIGSEGHSRAIIETLIDLAKNMRMEIIA